MKSLIFKRKYIKLLLVFIAFTLSCHTSNVGATGENIAESFQGIKFIEDDWNKALTQAKLQHKLIFLDIYATWCGPCRMLKNTTFADKGIGDFFNKNFINISVDGEKGLGPQLAAQYGIDGYPTLIIADETGKPVLFTVGYIPASELLKFGKSGLEKYKQ